MAAILQILFLMCSLNLGSVRCRVRCGQSLSTHLFPLPQLDQLLRSLFCLQILSPLDRQLPMFLNYLNIAHVVAIVVARTAILPSVLFQHMKKGPKGDSIVTGQIIDTDCTIHLLQQSLQGLGSDKPGIESVVQGEYPSQCSEFFGAVAVGEMLGTCWHVDKL